MQLNGQKFAWESAAITGMVYSICTIFVALFPAFSTKLMGWLFHLLNFEILGRGLNVTFGGFIAGLGQTVLYTYIGAWLFSWLFNRAVKS